MLAPSIERRREHATLLPFKGLLSTAFLPNRRRAASLYDIDELLKEVMLDQSLALGGNFTNVSVTTAPCAQHIDESSHCAFAFPRTQRDCSQILESQALIDRDRFALLP